MLAIKRKSPRDLGKRSDAGSRLDIFASVGPEANFAGVSQAGFGTGGGRCGSIDSGVGDRAGPAFALMLPIEATPPRPNWRNWKWPDAAGSGRRAESRAGRLNAPDCGR